MPAPRPEFADPLARFLGFDPENGLASMQLPDEPAPRLVAVSPQLAEDPPRTNAPLTLNQALAADPQKVLQAAMFVIMDNVEPEPGRRFLPAGGRYGQLRLAVCRAMREVAHAYRSEVQLSGWIIGKREDPHK